MRKAFKCPKTSSSGFVSVCMTTLPNAERVAVRAKIGFICIGRLHECSLVMDRRTITAHAITIYANTKIGNFSTTNVYVNILKEIIAIYENSIK